MTGNFFPLYFGTVRKDPTDVQELINFQKKSLIFHVILIHVDKNSG